MKKLIISGVILSSIFLAGCQTATQGEADRSSETTVTEAKTGFQEAVNQLVADSNSAILQLEVIPKNGFDAIFVKMHENILDKSDEEKLALCNEQHPKILDAYDTYYVNENDGIHKPVVDYFVEGFNEVVRTDIEAGDREKLTLVKNIEGEANE